MDKIDNTVAFNMKMSSEDYEKVKAVLPTKVFNEVETRREIAIMKEVMRRPGDCIIEKIDNTIEDWSSEKCEEIIKYKIRHK